MVLHKQQYTVFTHTHARARDVHVMFITQYYDPVAEDVVILFLF